MTRVSVTFTPDQALALAALLSVHAGTDEALAAREWGWYARWTPCSACPIALPGVACCRAGALRATRPA